MQGIPQAIKDLSATRGSRTTMGPPLLRDNIPTHDCIMVERMKGAGALIIGKTNTPELGLGSHTFNNVFGITGNAWDVSRCAGGSSGGTAVAPGGGPAYLGTNPAVPDYSNSANVQLGQTGLALELVLSPLIRCPSR